MSDEPAAPERAEEAESASKEPETPPVIAGVPLAAFVKGGTTTSAWDIEKQKLYAQSKELREHQDRQRQAIDDAAGKPNIRAALLSQNLMSRANPKVVIEYVYGDSALNRECLCEIATAPRADKPDEQDMILVLVCPRCLARTGRMDDAQIMIRESHRKFWVDYSKGRVWVNPVDGSVHTLCGNVTLKDKVSCSALGCTWRFAIEDSKLKEV
jgi:hypothetical protein